MGFRGLAHFERTLGVEAGVPILVSTNESVTDIVRYLAAESKRQEEFPEGIAGAVASLSRKADAPMAGYLFVYLTRHLISRNMELETSLLGKMISNPSVPPSARKSIGESMMVNYYYLSPQSRAVLIGHFVDLSLQSEDQASTMGFRGLAHITDFFHDEVDAMIAPSTRIKLANAYRTNVLSRKLLKNEFLGKLLGVQSDLEAKPQPLGPRAK